MEKIRVLHILHELHPSGAEMMLYNAYPYWENDCDCTIMGTGKIIGPFAGRMKEQGYEVVHVPTVGEGKSAKLVHLKAFYQYMKENKYDVVHIHRESLAFEYALIAKIVGCRNICRTVHNNFPHQGLQRRIKSGTRWMMRHMLHVRFIASSDGVAENEKRVFGNICDETIYNWCNNGKFVFQDADKKRQKKAEAGLEDKLVIVSVGNCSRVKNHELLLRAIAKMKQKDRLCYYHIGFDAQETQKEENLAEELGIADAVQFLGSTNPMPCLEMSDLFVMPSLFEGLSIATLEALFTGMPMLLAEVPGLSEFKNKGFGNVSYFQSTQEELASRLDGYVEKMKEGTLVPDMGQRKRAEELYDCKNQVRKHVQLYRGMMRRRGGE